MTTSHDTSHAPSGTRNEGRTFSIIGAVCGAVAIVFLPIVLGPIGAVLGFVGYSRGDRPLGMWVGIGAIVATVVGMALGLALFASAS